MFKECDMKIQFNCRELELESNKQLLELLKEKGYKKNVAVFLNKKKMLMMEVDKYIINENDIISVFKPLSGG